MIPLLQHFGSLRVLVLLCLFTFLCPFFFSFGPNWLAMLGLRGSACNLISIDSTGIYLHEFMAIFQSLVFHIPFYGTFDHIIHDKFQSFLNVIRYPCPEPYPEPYLNQSSTPS